MAKSRQFRVLCGCLPGLEAPLGRELARLGLPDGVAISGGVELDARLRDVHRLTLGAGIMASLRVRVERFEARHFDRLVKGARRVPWRSWIAADAPWRVEATASRSRLYHTRAIATRVSDVIAEALGSAPNVPAPNAAPTHPSRDGLVVHARMHRDRCTLSVEPSGLGLHRRGWRKDAGAAPLREDLASALLDAAGWTPDQGLCDPFCGSGTVVIEAARRRAGLLPGAHRVRELTRWAMADRGKIEAWTARMLEEALAQRVTTAPPIVGGDRSNAQLEAAEANATRAGVREGLELRCEDASVRHVDAATRGMMITNPPWGRRLRGKGASGSGELGALVSALPPSWGAAVVLPTQGRARFGRLGTGPVATVRVGGAQVRLEVRRAAATPADAHDAASDPATAD